MSAGREDRKEVKLGLRRWRLAIHHREVPSPDVIGRGADLAVVREWEAVPAAVRDTLLTDHGDWAARALPMSVAEHSLQVSGPCHVVGPAPLVDRFLAYLGLPPERVHTAQSPETEFGDRPELPDPAESPRFAEEGEVDMFAQDGAVQGRAWRRIAQAVGRITRDAHDGAMAVMLPPPEQDVPGRVDPALQPWKAVTPVDEFAARYVVEIAARAGTTDPNVGTGLLDLFQRCLVVSCGCGNAAAADALAELAENAGFVACSWAAPTDAFGDMDQNLYIGELAARMHESWFVHGDIHPGNFGFKPGVNSAVIIDAGSCYRLTRPLTIRERAADLAVMKAACTFLEWQLFRTGYTAVAGEVADDVFREFR